MVVADPTLDFERSLHAEGVTWVVGCDEVGRGAIAGPVAVGMSAVIAACDPHPAGLRDSKMLSEKRRELMYPLAVDWSHASAVGLAEPGEVDEFGIIAALGIAGKRALVQLHEQGVGILDSVVVLDGNHDYLSSALTHPPRITTRIKADRDCASVAAASVIAKVHRDRMMIDFDTLHPGYGWAGNKGYGSATHYEALQALGPSPLHRLTWLR
ncbi:ribonuclease HII [Frondihabitans sp. VKM Ac-2883]|uniref:ribonuclease HII n=1 Tax=Frondihabitans sp. VKM Ac-2883 TaxID=2783823 RepID=UPI00188CA97A|nr:ribonuclease HII [Frondihabitans sp. VKM Ac-2883]MBF4577801.1 ribonuclease HII [Frondihabitans sp. VKM Ac-2883]